jgi:pimeloyl-ACP methyl ester carboxylesterase
MNEESGFLDTGDGRLAWRRVDGAGPQIVWVGGFASDMTGTKAQSLAEWAMRQGRAFLRFDYFGHGASDGQFRDGVISRWRGDALAVIDDLTEGPLILVGSSMGGWISCLAALSRPERVAGMVLIAPAPDFTEKLMKPALHPEATKALAESGEWVEPDGAIITAALLEDGARWSILDAEVDIDCPVHILQGGADDVVPWRHAQSLALALRSQEVVFTLIKDGDHRLSREQDLARLVQTVEAIAASPSR